MVPIPPTDHFRGIGQRRPSKSRSNGASVVTPREMTWLCYGRGISYDIFLMHRNYFFSLLCLLKKCLFERAVLLLYYFLAEKDYF